MRKCTNCGRFCNKDHKPGLCILFKIREGPVKNEQINIYGRKNKIFKLGKF
jgi:hypothetical protein